MKTSRPDIVLRRVLDALEADLLSASDAEIAAIVAETGMNAGALLSDVGSATGLKSVRTDLYGAMKNREDADRPDVETVRDPVAPGRRPHPS